MLIKEAQQHNQQAIDELCLRFTPLVYKEARSLNVYNALGEDAVSIAWTIFLSFIQRYNGADYKHLPGLIQCHLRYELLHHIQKQGYKWDNELMDLPDNDADDNVSFDPMQSLLLNLALLQELKQLTKRQQKILWLYYVDNQSHEAIAKLLHCSARTVGYQRELALKKLKSKMTG